MMRCLLALTGVAMGIGAAVPPALALDLAVTHLEVTQGTQKSDNSVPLVAGRATAVRATVTSDSMNRDEVILISGRLFVWVDGIALPPTGGTPSAPTGGTPPIDEIP